MQAVQLFAHANSRRRKSRSRQVALVVFVSTILGLVALSLLQRLDGPLEAMAKAQKASQLSYVVDTQLYSVRAITNWFRLRPETLDIIEFASVQIQGQSNYLKHGSDTEYKLEHSLQISEYDAARPSDLLLGADGQDLAVLKPNEVFIPNSLASIYKLKAGDSLELMTATGYNMFRIAAVIIDPQYSPLAITNMYRIWIGSGELIWHFSLAQLSSVTVQVRLNDTKQATSVNTDFLSSMAGGFSGYVLTWASIEESYGFIFKILSSALLLISLLLLLIAVFVLYTTISGSVLTDARIIGVLKTLGFTPGNVVASYTLQYVKTALLATAAASPFAWFLSELLSKSFMSSLSASSQTLGFIQLCLVVLPLELVFLAFCASVFSLKAGRLRSVEALRTGEAALSKFQTSAHRISSKNVWPLEAMVAFKLFMANRRRAIFLGITGFLASFMLVFSFGFYGFMKGTASDFAFWGFPDSHAQVTLPPLSELSTADFLDRVQSNPRVAQTMVSSWAFVDLPDGKQVFCDIAGGDFDLLGFSILEGQNPKKPDELALAHRVAELYGYHTGSELVLSIAGTATRFTVSGIYQSTNQMGMTCRMTLDAYRRADPQFAAQSIHVWLTDEAQTEVFAQEINERYGSSMPVIANKGYYRNAINSYVGSSNGIIILIVLIVALACIAVIKSDTSIEIESSLKSLGLLKTLGYTPLQLRLILAEKNAGIVAFGASLGALLAIVVQAPLIALPLKIVGIKIIEIRPDLILVLLVLACLSLVAGLTTWLSTRTLQSLSVKTLVVE